MRDKDTVYFTYYSGPDKEMCYSFMMEWWQENFHMGPSWRGQMYKADPLPYIVMAEAWGKKIVETKNG